MWISAFLGLAFASTTGDLIEILKEMREGLAREEHQVKDQEPLEAVKSWDPAREFAEKRPVARAQPSRYYCVDDQYYTEETGSQPLFSDSGEKNLDFWVTIWGLGFTSSSHWDECQKCGKDLQEKGYICGGWECSWYLGTTMTLYRDGRPCPPCAPTPGDAKLTGRWTRRGSSSHGQEFTLTEGTTRSMSFTEAQSWSHTVTQSASAGIEVEGVGGVSTSIEASTSMEIATSLTSSFSKTKTETWKWSAPAGVVWQWEFDVDDNCGKATVMTPDVVVTSALTDPPCCLPGYFKDPMKATGACRTQESTLC